VTGGRSDVCVGRSKGDKQKSDQPDRDVNRLIVHRKGANDWGRSEGRPDL